MRPSALTIAALTGLAACIVVAEAHSQTMRTGRAGPGASTPVPVSAQSRKARIMGGDDLNNGIAFVQRCAGTTCAVPVKVALPPAEGEACIFETPGVVLLGKDVAQVTWTVESKYPKQLATFVFRNGAGKDKESKALGVHLADVIDHTDKVTKIWNAPVAGSTMNQVSVTVNQPIDSAAPQPAKATAYDIYVAYTLGSPPQTPVECLRYDPIIINTGS